MKRLRQKDRDFIKEYVSINMPNYKRIARHDPSKLIIVFAEIETDFKKIFDKKELETAMDIAKDRVFSRIM